jgi:hypothetical protein
MAAFVAATADPITNSITYNIVDSKGAFVSPEFVAWSSGEGFTHAQMAEAIAAGELKELTEVNSWNISLAIYQVRMTIRASVSQYQAESTTRVQERAKAKEMADGVASPTPSPSKKRRTDAQERMVYRPYTRRVVPVLRANIAAAQAALQLVEDNALERFDFQAD